MNVLYALSAVVRLESVAAPKKQFWDSCLHACLDALEVEKAVFKVLKIPFFLV